MVKFARYANSSTMKTNVVLAIVSVLLVCSSCDMFRKIAGRPTSDEIEARRSEAVKKDAMIEALKQRQQAQADSLAIVDSIRRMETDVLSLSEIGDLYTTALDHRYYIIVGSFRNGANADAMLKTASDAGYVPVISPVGVDAYSQTYNINADYAASAIAGALNAQKLVFLTDVEGILRDKDDPSTIIRRMNAKEAMDMIADGTINGGMIPKVECCLDALSKGVNTVHVLDGRLPHSMLLEIFTADGIGTMVTPEVKNVK